MTKTEEERQRAIMSRTHLECARNVRKALFPQTPLYDAMEMILIGRVIMVAQYEGHRISKAGVARAIGMPRQTLNRRIKKMAELGFLKQEGHKLCVLDSLLETPISAAATRKNARLFREAAAKLYQNGQN